MANLCQFGPIMIRWFYGESDRNWPKSSPVVSKLKEVNIRLWELGRSNHVFGWIERRRGKKWSSGLLGRWYAPPGRATRRLSRLRPTVFPTWSWPFKVIHPTADGTASEAGNRIEPGPAPSWLGGSALRKNPEKGRRRPRSLYPNFRYINPGCFPAGPCGRCVRDRGWNSRGLAPIRSLLRLRITIT
jgi:hypothetical protein